MTTANNGFHYQLNFPIVPVLLDMINSKVKQRASFWMDF